MQNKHTHNQKNKAIKIAPDLVKSINNKINIPNRFAESELERKYKQVLVEIQTLHNELKRIPTVAELREHLRCDCNIAMLMLRMYRADTKNQTLIGANIELPSFLTSAIKKSLTMVIDQQMETLNVVNEKYAKINEDLYNQIEILKAENKLLQNKLNESENRCKDLEIQYLKHKYEPTISTLTDANNFVSSTNNVKSVNSINSLNDLFKK